MPGNEVGERVHNFFAPDNLSQGQHHSQIADGNWQVVGNNLWVGNQRHIGGPSSKSKTYSQQLSDNERGNNSHSVQVPYGLSSTQSTPRPDFPKNQSQSPQPNLNGYFHGHQVFQTRQNETNFLGVDTESDQRNITSEGLSIYELQQGNGPEQHTKISVRSETSEPPVGFDFFVGQQQMGSQQPHMLQSLQRQQSGYNEMQLQQQQVMFRKMQELQRQQQLQQLEARQQNSINQFSTIAKQGSGNHSPDFITGNPLTEASHYPWATELAAGNTSWMQHASSAIQGSSNGLMFPPEQGQAMRLRDLVPQQVDQSLYGIPISSTRGNQNQYSHITVDMPPVQQTSTRSNSFPGNQYAVYPDKVSMQDGTLVSGQGFQEKDSVGHASGRSLNSGMNLENLQQGNALQRNASMQEFGRRQELARSLDTGQEKTVMSVAPKNAVALDPTEEKILFGTDENIWDAFGGSIHMNTGGSNLLDGTGLLNGFPSVQSGSWSALMQSAVAETSSNETGLQEEWTGLSFQNTEVPTGNHQPSTCNNSGKQQTFLADNRLQIASALSSGSVPLSGNANMKSNYLNVPASQQSGHKISHEHGERLPGILSHMSISQSSEEGSKWSNRGPLQKPFAEGSRVLGNGPHSLDVEMNVKGITGSWTPQQPIPSYRTGFQPCNKPIDRNGIESVSPSVHAPLKIHENENSLRYWRSNDKGPISEEMGNNGGIWKADCLSNSTGELEHARSAMGSPEVNRDDSSLNAVGVLPISSTTRARQETRQLLPNSRHLNYWRDANSALKCEGSEASGKSQHYLNKSPQVPELLVNTSDRETVKMHEMENCDIKENSSDSYHSNLSHHNSTGGFRENILSDASDSRILPAGKQKSSGQAARRISGSRKFQYHPMGNLDEDVEPSHGAKHSTHSQAVSQQMSRGSKSHGQQYFGQSKLFGQGSKNSVELEKGHLSNLQGNTKGLDEVPSRGILPGSMRNMSAPFDSSVGTYAPDKTTQSSQNMLELLHKVDQSRECGTVMPSNSFERNSSSNMPREDIADGSVGNLRQNQSVASQGFSLQLAPPSQRLPVLNRALSAQSPAHTVNSDGLSLTTPEIKDKGHTWLAPAAEVRSLPPSHETSQVEFRNSKTGIPGQTGNEASQHHIRGTISSAFTSGFPISRSQNQDQCMTNTSELVTTNQSTDITFDRFASRSKQADESCSRALIGQSATAFLPDTSGRIPHNNPASSVDAPHPTGANYSFGISDPQLSAEEYVPVSQPSVTTSGTSEQSAFSKMLPNVWTSVPTSFPAQQRALGAQSHKSLNFFQSNQSNKNVESTSFAPQNLEDEDPHKRGNDPSAFVASSTNSHGFVCGEENPAREGPSQQVSSGNIDLREKISASQGRESISKHLSDATPSNAASIQRDVEAFGRSLKPNHHNYSLLHQMQVMRSAENDPSERGLNRIQGTHSGQGGLQVAPSTGQSNDRHTRGGDALLRRNVVLSGDSEMLSFSGPVNNWEACTSSQLRNDPQIYPRNNNTATVRVEHPQISPQMAPSWFNQFGTFKNGQMMPMYDSRKIADVKSLGQPFTLAKPSDSLHVQNSTEQVIPAADTNQVGNTWRTSTPKEVATEYLSSPQLLHPDVTDQRLVAVRPKKRKSATSELLPWCKEVTHGSQSLRTISIAEVDWAKAANRLIDKVEDGAETIEDGSPMLRPKKRLILTTQLMQQLFHPPTEAVLSADAACNYESLICLVARLSMGDACSLISCCGSNSHGPLDSMNLISDKSKSSERINDQHLSKVMEDFIFRARKLENDLLRLDKRASLLDLSMECQELEKYSVINRFAKFHGRGQGDGAENSSSSNAATNAQKPFPQRYVTALPMPRNIPDRVQCLSL
ncbi:uncharacterized protein LOC132284110 [Cornus florida]|uniref:uncharacterized protein LOC132284110 n=1 Tax=Cornus florida TaxID=4283 RepID=UPI002897A38C|nr:uncharacterized protein LOC132284110 [Cornus florida]